MRTRLKEKWKKLSRLKKVSLLSFMALCIGFYFSLPNPLIKKPFSTVLYDANRKLLSARIATDGQWRFPQPDSVPQKFRECILEFEDRYFYYHPGVNAGAVCNALWQNIRTGKTKRGGSTLTMQLARICRDNPGRTYWEKVWEMWLALRIECAYSKEEILSLYAGNAPFGGNTVGLEAASWRYFGRNPWQLSWAEAALLAVLPNAPSLIYPGKNHHLLEKKRNRLLNKLKDKGIISKADYELALLEKIPHAPANLPNDAPHLLQRLIKERGEGKIYTSTIIKEMQLQAQQLVNEQVKNLSNNFVHNACVLILNTQTGETYAYVGNSQEKKSRYENDVDLIKASRSPGSILKPLLYGLMMNDGKISPYTLLEDIPMQLGSYAPKNFNLTYDGLVPANEAIARSLNVPAVKLLKQCGVAYYLSYLRRLGFTTLKKPASHYGLSLILGGAEVSPWEVGSVYASLGRSLHSYGLYSAYVSNDIREAQLLKAELPNRGTYSNASILSAGSTWHMLNAMSELARPDQYSTNSLFNQANKIAWKTGTSFGFRDAWAIGLNQKYTVVVWAGNADGEGRPGLTGIQAAAPLLFAVFNTLQGNKWFVKPKKDLVKVKLCRVSGCKTSVNCVDVIEQELAQSVLKTSVCTFHKIVHTDSLGTFQVSSNCYPVAKMKEKSYLILSPLQSYFYKQHHADYIQPPPYQPGCVNEGNYLSFDIIYPRQGFRIYLPQNELGEKNALVMNATHIKKDGHLFWYLDKTYLGETVNYHQIQALPEKGKHELFIADENGKSLQVTFEVVDK